jgi:Rod binding domain-containing protein
MSIQPTSNAATAAGLPAVNQALEPEWVRRGSAATQRAYDSALAFEQTLVEQLSKSMADASGLGGESSSEGEAGAEEGGSSTGGAGNSQLSSMLPQALSASVMNAGGLGMAAQMTRQLEGAAQTQASNGTAPAPSSDAAIAAATGGAGS